MHRFIQLSLKQVANVEQLKAELSGVFDENYLTTRAFPFIQQIYSSSKAFPPGKSGGEILFQKGSSKNSLC